MIIGINGVLVAPSGRLVGMAGSGKDTVADFLVMRQYFAKVALADELKRICMRVYDFTVQQLWGPSALRSEPDKRWPRPAHDFHGDMCICCRQKHKYINDFTRCYLTPRYALQLLGTEWGRKCYPDIWVDITMRDAKKLAEEGGYSYSTLNGLDHWWHPGQVAEKTSVAIPDVRFKNEIVGIKAGGGKVVRVVRPIKEEPEYVDLHPSEQEALAIPDSEFDYIIPNSEDLHHLELQTGRMYDFLSGRIQAYDPEQEDVPPFKRS